MLIDGEDQIDTRGNETDRGPLTLRELARRRLRLEAGARALETASIEGLPPVVGRYILFEHHT